MDSFKGAVSETYIPWNNYGKIDSDCVKQQIEFQIGAGIKGLFAVGLNATEKLYLEPGEPEEYVDLMTRYAAGRVPVMANVMENSTKRAKAVLKSYEQSGADAICITQPYGNALTQNAIRTHFEALLDSTDMPCCIYNMPQAGYILSPELIAELSDEFPNLMYYKNSTQNMVHLQTVIDLVSEKKPGFEFYEGSDGTILASMIVGGHGVISAISNYLPHLIIDLCDAALAGDWKTAQELNKTVIKVRNINKKIKSGLPLKYLVQMLGCNAGGELREPLSFINADEQEYLMREYKRLGLL